MLVFLNHEYEKADAIRERLPQLHASDRTFAPSSQLSEDAIAFVV
ncbi:MAG: hypothetical protein AB1589_26255 [Cyanobacteriota bacterium]